MVCLYLYFLENSLADWLSHPDHNKATSILSRAREYQSTASQHRLNQPVKLNAGLQAANATKINDKISYLKRQGAKGDTITMEATLFYYPKNGAGAKKVAVRISDWFIALTFSGRLNFCLSLNGSSEQSQQNLF